MTCTIRSCQSVTSPLTAALPNGGPPQGQSSCLIQRPMALLGSRRVWLALILTLCGEGSAWGQFTEVYPS